VADFSTWTRENLVKFCFDASEMLADQDGEISTLREELKAAIRAYRYINTKENDKLEKDK